LKLERLKKASCNSAHRNTGEEAEALQAIPFHSRAHQNGDKHTAAHPVYEGGPWWWLLSSEGIKKRSFNSQSPKVKASFSEAYCFYDFRKEQKQLTSTLFFKTL